MSSISKIGWTENILSDICTVKDGTHDSPKYVADGIPFVTQKNIRDGQVNFDKVKFISQEDHDNFYKRSDVKLGDILIAMIGVNRGEVGLVNEPRIFSIKNVGLIKASPNINMNYLLYYLKSDFAKKYVDSQSRGGAQPFIGLTKLRVFPILHPGLEEQKRIVVLLDTVFADLEQTRAKTEQNLKNSRELFESYLQQVFSQKGEGWEEKKWGDMCKFIRGPFGGSLKKSMFKSEGYAVYEQKHAIHDHIEQLRYYVDEEKFEEMKRFELKPGELIMSCSGVTLGRASVIPEGAPKGIINQALLKLTANDDFDIHFLKYWIRSKIFQDIIFEHAGGAAIPNVPAAKILKEIKLQIPTLEKQKIIVSEIDSMVSKRDSLLRIYTEKLAALDELKKSILQKAFSGKLTTTAK